jgi:hypothetical protein
MGMGRTSSVTCPRACAWMRSMAHSRPLTRPNSANLLAPWRARAHASRGGASDGLSFVASTRSFSWSPPGFNSISPRFAPARYQPASFIGVALASLPPGVPRLSNPRARVHRTAADATLATTSPRVGQRTGKADEASVSASCGICFISIQAMHQHRPQPGAAMQPASIVTSCVTNNPLHRYFSFYFRPLPFACQKNATTSD